MGLPGLGRPDPLVALDDRRREVVQDRRRDLRGGSPIGEETLHDPQLVWKWTAGERLPQAFDDRVGFSDRYVTKLENGDKPGMKRGIHIQPETDRIAVSFSAELWLEGNGLALVLMPREQALAIGAQPAPKREAA